MYNVFGGRPITSFETNREKIENTRRTEKEKITYVTILPFEKQ